MKLLTFCSAFAGLFVLLLLTGCETPTHGENDISDHSWNRRESWEGGVGGFEGSR